MGHKLIRSFFIVMFLLLYGCQPAQTATPQPASKRSSPSLKAGSARSLSAEEIYNSHINIRGKITQIIGANEFLVEGVREPDTDYARAIVRLTDHSTLMDKGVGCTFSYSKSSTIKEGQVVEVTFNSPIEESDPVRAEASQVIILDQIQAGSPDQALIPQTAQINPSIRGSIAKITHKNNQVTGVLINGVRKPDTTYDRAFASLLRCTRIYVKQNGQYQLVDASQLHENVQVEVLFFGRIGASYPVQAQAREIIILSQAGLQTDQKLYVPAIQN